MIATQVILAPIMTEKSNEQRAGNKYAFIVNKRANKIQIENAIHELFQVRPVHCNVVNVKGKPKRRGRHEGTTSSWKKAIVTLREGESIQIFEGA